MKQSYNLWYEIKYIKYNNNIGECYFKNGSYIKIVTMADTARSARANIIFIDEFVKSRKDIIETALLRSSWSLNVNRGFILNQSMLITQRREIKKSTALLLTRKRTGDITS